MKPKIGLVGYFGWGNFGDELFVDAHREHLSEHFDLEVVSDMTVAPYLSDARVDSLKDFDAFLIGGGDLINPAAISSLYWRQEYLEKPVFVYGIGVPQPAKKASKSISYYQEFFRHKNTKCTVLRDIESKRYFDSVIQPAVAAVTYPDAVCAMTLPKAVPSESKLLGVTIRSHGSVVGGYEHVRRAVNQAKELGYKVRIIVMGNGKLGAADHEVSQDFLEEDEELVYSESLDDICVAIGECHQLISIKFHGMIVAAMYGVPSLQLSSTAKNRNFLRYIQRLDMLSSYNSDDLFERVSRYPVPLHSLLRTKLKRDSRAGYAHLIACMRAELGI